MATIGWLSMIIAFVSALASIVTFLIGHYGSNDSMTKAGYYLTFAALGGATLGVTVLTVGFYTHDYSLLYVATNRSTDVSALAWLYQGAAVWAGREGSLLFWAWLITLFGGYKAWRSLRTREELTNIALVVLNAVVLIFFAALILSEPNNPFKETPPAMLANGALVGQAASWGMNPLLQHWAMMLHPPTLFIGYAGLTVPFAYALSALIVGDASDTWVELNDRITIFAWLFLGLGTGLGSVWAYVVLGWGGFWAWDPVENASILPWFVGIGLIHSFTMYRRRGAFKRWAIMLSALTFSMVILGTFITRSGVVQSVHAFAADPVSLWLFLIMIIGAPLIVVIGLAMRWQLFAGADEFESLTSREAAYYFNNVLMTVASLLIAYMTLSSAFPQWMPLGGQAMGPTAYELVARPVGILYLLILAVCPLLSWAKTDGTSFLKKTMWPAIAALPIFALLMVEWVIVLRPVYRDMVAAGGEPARAFLAFGPQFVYDAIAVIAFAASAFLITTTSALFIRGVRARMTARDESVLTALGNVLFKARKQSGGYLSHLAIGLVVIGLVGSGAYVRDVAKTFPNEVGEEIVVADYTLTFAGVQEITHINNDIDEVAYFDVSRDGRFVGTINPSITHFATQGQTRLNARVLFEPLRDIFVVFQGVVDGQVSAQVKINPLIWFMWGGFGLLMVGNALAMWPTRKRVDQAVG
ncbi:MAG: cytochrome c biogenesis protein CcsA [Coriobacteriia bacterium]|nr:cytochrome c biogenesis protein CcsA [Coriobacteriia bacterium]